MIAGQQLSYGTYLERLRALPTGEYLAPEPGQHYPPGVAAAVLLSLDAARASDQSGVSARLMETIAVLSGAGVHRALLHAAGQAGVLAGDGQRVAPALVDGALEHLARWSLLAFSLDGQTIIMHDLVTRVVRDWLACRQRLTAAGWAAALVLEAQSRLLPDPQDRPAIRDISAHVMALAENMGGSADEELMRALLRLRFFVLSHLIELGDRASQADRQSASRSSRTSSGYWALTIPTPSSPGTTSRSPTGPWAGTPRRSRCSSRPWLSASGSWASAIPGPWPPASTWPRPTMRRAGQAERFVRDCAHG